MVTANKVIIALFDSESDAEFHQSELYLLASSYVTKAETVDELVDFLFISILSSL